MNEKQRKQIHDYSNKIEEKDNFVDAVRQVPGMYIGPLGNEGHINMIREVYQNSIDELSKCDFCNKIAVSYDERTCRAIVEDNGRGIPFELLIKLFTNPHISSNYSKEKGEYSSGLHGIGAKVTNALSSEFTVISSILGESKKIHFIEGIPTEEGIVDVENNNKQGTMVTFIPNFEIMGNITTKIPDVLHLIKSILYLTNIGSSVTFNGIMQDGTPYSEELTNEDGLLSFLILKTTSPVVKPIEIFDDTGFMKANIVFTFDSSNITEPQLDAFANMCPTTKGTHINGFYDGVCKFFREYMNKVYLASNKKNKLTVLNTDILPGLRGAISAFHLKPTFTGQAKEILSNKDLYEFVKDLVVNRLEEWSKSNPNDLQKLCKYFKDIAEIRSKADKDKVKLTSKFGSSLNKGLPLKFTKPTESWDEFIIVEGDSAGGSAKNSRDKRTQGIFPIKGKIPNALTNTNKQKFLNNEEVHGIITIIGGGYGKSFDISKVKWKKIIFMPDADADGKHIANLLLKLFLVYMRPLIEAGRVYKAVPPLYGITLPGGKHKYFTERIDYVEYLQNLFSKENTITALDGRNLNHNDIMRILYNNVDYTYELERIASRYSLEPRLLELLLFNKNNSIDNLRNAIKKEFRFMDVETQSGITVLSGIINSTYQTLYTTDKFYYDVKEIEKILQINDSLYYNINNQPNTLYQLMKKFEKTAPKKLTRYKGLGEMDPDQLGESTLKPENRTLIQYTSENIQKDLDEIKYLESNKNLLIKDIKATRLDLMG